MLNRRHIRAKVMQVLYANTCNEMQDKLENQLEVNMNSTYRLYLVLLSLLPQIRKRAIEHQKKAQKKHLATLEDTNPNRQFVDNAFLVSLAQNEYFIEELKIHKIKNWSQDGEYVELIFRDMLKSSLYHDYMKTGISSLKTDVNFIVQLYKQIVAPNPKLYDYLQDQNITWIDDLPVVNTFLVKLIQKFKANTPTNYFSPPLFKDNEDQEFGFKLLKQTSINIEQYNEIIIENTKNWDKDRIAITDFILLQMALCELNEFPSIPVKVTINEYVELAKDYSTPKSNVFINGILDKIVKDYENEKTLNKKGRGLR